MVKEKTMKFKIVKTKSEINKVGLYRIIGNDGFFWGNYRATINWCGDFLIQGCDGYGRIY